jgi:hypothetical protein
MKTEETKIVTYPCTDGSTIIVTEGIAESLRGEGVTRVRAVKAAGRRYYYIRTDFFSPVHDFMEDVPLWKYVVMASELYKQLPGDGQVSHDDSDSFLLSNFTRDAEPKAKPGAEPRQPRPAKVYASKVSAEVIQRQLKWFSEPSLHLEAVKWAAVHTNPKVGEEVLQQTSIKLLEQIRGGQCLALTAEQFHNYFLTAVGRKARRARVGLNRSEVIPDLLSRKDLTEVMTHENYYEGQDRGVRRTAPKQSLSGLESHPD